MKEDPLMLFAPGFARWEDGHRVVEVDMMNFECSSFQRTAAGAQMKSSKSRNCHSFSWLRISSHWAGVNTVFRRVFFGLFSTFATGDTEMCPRLTARLKAR
jgi:hypothetical protein